MLNDAGTQQAAQAEPFLQPVVSWAADMTFGRRYLVTVNLILVNDDGSPALWPLEDEEEYAYTCLLDGEGAFKLWPVHDTSVVLHRFGGSYGPAEFVVTPSEPKSGGRSIWLTILNQWGISVGDYELPVELHVLPGDQTTIPDPINVPAGLSAEAGQPVGTPGNEGADELDPGTAQEFAETLASGNEITVDIPLRDLPDIRDEPRDAESGRRTPRVAREHELSAAGRTAPDIPRQSEDDRGAEDQAAITRRDWEHDRERSPSAVPAVPRRWDTARLTGPLGEYYHIAGLRRSRSGGLHADMVPLFPPGAARGDRITFTACCSPSDERGTVFAVVAQPGDGSDRSPQPRSIQSAKIPPGLYQVTAELLYPNPGHIRFHGLPTEPREDPRPWQEIIASVPRRLPASGGPAHLIVAIEISGPDDHSVQERLDSARRLILYVSAEARDFVCYSVITYGPHSVHLGNRYYPEVPAATLAWAVAADDALVKLDQLTRRGPAPFGYEHAAQLECVLTDLEAGLSGEEGRPVIVTVGARPPHPPRIDPVTGIIPCRYRNDWAVPMVRLQSRHAGIKFGSFRDAGRVDQLWRLLGADAAAADDVYVRGFAQSLGLTSAAEQPTAPPIALPLLTG